MEGRAVSVSLGVRKGAWSKAEDAKLRNCIETYGEGKWHLVPSRAELNRCRKSCRLRWLNYLRPNLNRASFSEDEVDLLIRLQKLLGNRWTLIAGRLPGRTANDVKNFWNSHQLKKAKAAEKKTAAAAPEKKPENTTVFKPQPLRLSDVQKACTCSDTPGKPNNTPQTHSIWNPGNMPASPPSLGFFLDDGSNSWWWWGDLLGDNGDQTLNPPELFRSPDSLNY